MLAKLKNKIDVGKLKLIHGDFLNLELKEEPYDAILMSLVLEHISDLDIFFEKARRHLMARGQLYISEIHPQRSAAGILAHFKTLEGKDIHLKSSPHSEDEIKRAAEKSGFKIGTQETVCGNSTLANLNPKWQKHLNQPLIQMWRLHL